MMLDFQNTPFPSIEVELNQILKINEKIKVSFGLMNEMADVIMHTGNGDYQIQHQENGKVTLKYFQENKNLKERDLEYTNIGLKKNYCSDGSYAHLTQIAPHVNPPPKAARIILSPFLS